MTGEEGAQDDGEGDEIIFFFSGLTKQIKSDII